MAITAEMLDKVSEIVRAELPTRLPDSIRVRQVKAATWMGGEDEFIHVTVIYEGDRRDLDPRTLNEFDDEIEPLLVEIGVNRVPPISYANLREVDTLASAEVTTE